MDREFTSEAGSRPRYRLRILSQFLLTAGLLIITSCSKVEKRSVDNRTEETGAEPRRYSALIIRTIRDGDDEFTTETRIARDGELSRQEWTENGERRVSILRPDLGKAFTLSIERAIYTESPTDWMSANTQDGNAVSAKESHREGSAGIDPQAIDRALALPPDPDSLEIIPKPDVTLAGHTCGLTEQRMSFPDGHVEITRTYRAIDLGGLAIRVDYEGPGKRGTVGVITELRDIKLDVSGREFEIPEHFRRVERL